MTLNKIDNLTSIQYLLIKACLEKDAAIREHFIREWEEIVVMDDLDFSCVRLIPFFFHGNQKLGITTKYDGRIKIIYKHWWLRSKHINHQLKETHAALFAAGIDTVLMKGASIKKHYELDELRCMADFDLMVSPSDLPNAIQVIKKMDYLPNEIQESYLKEVRDLFLEVYHAIVFVNQNNDTNLDLHWRVGSRCSIGFTDHLWGNLEKYDGIPNAKCPQLAYEVFMIIVHAVDTRNQDNLNWIIDIAVINEKEGHSFWQEARLLAINEKKVDLFDYGCSILISLGVYALAPQDVKIPQESTGLTYEDKARMNLITFYYNIGSRLIRSVNRKFPHSNWLTRSYQLMRQVKFLLIARQIRSRKNLSTD